jgi:hypothetical protein
LIRTIGRAEIGIRHGSLDSPSLLDDRQQPHPFPQRQLLCEAPVKGRATNLGGLDHKEILA